MENVAQMSLWEYIYPLFKFPKGYKVRMFEAFSGIGCQAMALKRITANYDLVGFSEIDKYAIQSYKAIHGDVKNYGDITKMTSIPSCDIFTYSFPCTDLSKAGKQMGLGKETRSGLVYEVLRLLKATSDKPKVLIMENVVDLVQVNFVKQFNEIQYELEKLGYKNYNEVCNAKDYGIPQNRERVFMVSVLGDYSYEFPRKQKLELRLKDLLETNVDEKYYLSDKQLSQIQAWNSQTNPIDEALKENDETSQTITAKSNTSMNASMILLKEPCVDIVGNYSKSEHNASRIVDDRGLAPAVKENHGTVTATYNHLRIRKLTERECWRLMGISDGDFDKARDSGFSKSQLYKQAGNGICVPVFQKILENLFDL